jgi:hypothetical protein
MFRIALPVLLALAAILMMPAAGQAQATRTWVSGVGDDANPCSRTAPCKTFAGAISKTASGGEINAIDSGGFGAVTITKPISIVCEGVTCGVLAAGTNGIIVNAPATADVRLEGLDIEGALTGLNGIRILSADSVTIERSTIHGFASGSGTGIDVSPSVNPARVYVNESTISHNLVGISAVSAAPAVRVGINDTSIIANTDTGVRADGQAVQVNVMGSMIAHNNKGIVTLNSGQIVSAGDNNLLGNITANGLFTSTFLLK